MHSKELRYYDGLTSMDSGLLTLYKDNGFQVCHLEWADPAHEKTAEARAALRARVAQIKLQAYEAFQYLPKPVLIHCSAAIDRSTPVAAYILAELELAAP
jgi:protein-tyrosine phosphatase